jgi:hypothetical protein
MASLTEVTRLARRLSGVGRGKFSDADDAKLVTAIHHLGTSDWAKIAREVATRNARQCRDRWRNYLNPSLALDIPWTDDEDAILVTKIGEIGAKWISLSQFFPTRSINSLKTRYHLLQRLSSSFRRRRPDASICDPAEVHCSVNSKPQADEPDPFHFLESLKPEFEQELAYGIDPLSEFF